MTVTRTHVIALAAALAAAAGPALAADAPVQKVSVRAVAYFDFDQATIRPQDRDKLLAEVGKMKGVTWQAVTATGHTDSVGSADYNAKLAERRADAVKTYLVGKGLDASMIQAEAKASAAPVAPNNTPAGRAKNRRAEVEFQGVQAPAGQ